MEAVILAGGFGTRLRDVVADTPKPMAPINDKPFLEYLFAYLSRHGVTSAILSTGYLHEKIEQHFGSSHTSIRIGYSQEIEPLGTGGGIKLALAQADSEHVVVVNGDTFFDVDLGEMLTSHLSLNADLTIALKPMRNIERYGVVQTAGSRVVRFDEKQATAVGQINGGVYILRKTLFDGFDLPENFSLEEGFLKKHIESLQIRAFVSDSYFIDIGIPEDYARAQTELVPYA